MNNLWRKHVDNRIRASLGNDDLTNATCALAFLLGLVWLALFLTLLAGLGFAILNLIELAYKDAETENRTPFFVLAALTATLGAVVALPFTIIRTRFTSRQTKASEEGLITDRINAAVANLGATRNRKVDKDTETTEPNLEVRIGAILALERLSVKNSVNDPDLHVQIMEILCAYIRENAPARTALPGPARSC